MADESRERPYVLQWRSAVLNSQLASTPKLCLLALAEFADADGANCYPSIQTLAGRASINEKTARGALDTADAGGWIRRTQKGTSQGWRRFDYTLIVPDGADTTPARSSEGADTTPARSSEGADTTPARSSEGADTTPAASRERCGNSVRNVRALTPERAGVTPTDLSITYPLPREKQKHVQQEQTPAGRFAEFWAAYPRKAGKAKAAQAWNAKQLDKIAEQVLTDVIARVADPRQWTDPTYIPHPTTYLNGSRWEDEWKSTATHATKPSVADDFRGKRYTGTAIEDLPESLRGVIDDLSEIEGAANV